MCSSARAGDEKAPAAGATTAPARYRVSVLTMGQGPELFARFGHIAFLVEDLSAKTEKVYNFGTFDFQNPALRFKYLRGYLIYWVGVQGFSSTVRNCHATDRTLTQHVLALTPDAAERLAQKLAVNARPENREYEYRHYLDNCCTRIRDLVDEASGGAIAAGRRGKMTGRTYRDWTRRSLEGPITSNIAINFMLGPAVDQPVDRWAEEFLPSVMAEDLDQAVRPDGSPLVASTKVLYARSGPPVESVCEPWDAPVISLFLFLFVLGLALPIAVGAWRPGLGARLAGVGIFTWAFLGGLGGAILTFLWAGTTHYDTHYNENLLCFLPTHLFLFVPAVVLIVRGRLGDATGRLVLRYLAVSALVVVAVLVLKLRPAPQDNYGFMVFGFAMDLACLAALLRTKVVDLPAKRK